MQDELSKQLRAEFKQLARDVKDKKQSIVPGAREESEYFDTDPVTGRLVEDENGRQVSSKYKINFVN